MKRITYICDICGCEIKNDEINEIHIVNVNILSGDYKHKGIEYHGHICDSCSRKIMKEVNR